MSLRKMSGIVPDAMHEIMRLIDAKHEEKGSVRESVRESVQDGVQACIADDLVVENRPSDPRKRARRAGRGRGGKQLELGLITTK